MNHLAKVGRKSRKDSNDEEMVAKQYHSLAAFKRCPIFAELSSNVVNEALSSFSFGFFPWRKQVYTQGQKGSHLFVISAGRVRISRIAEGERAQTIAYRGCNEIVGETVLLNGQTYRETATSTEYVETVAIPLSFIKSTIETDSKFSMRFIRLMIERSLEAERRIENFLKKGVEARVVDFIVGAAASHGIPESRGTLIGMKFTHQEIADYVGSTRETVTIILGELRRRGLIQVDHRRLIVANADALSKLV
ncbi:MAG: Crp/Fnr family transcriptional regulator [Deltaproteobacteria bacterium]|nr:Crp/Fnr family transcriptional regulator [Deltaproteobacteria bacterium]